MPTVVVDAVSVGGYNNDVWNHVIAADANGILVLTGSQGSGGGQIDAVSVGGVACAKAVQGGRTGDEYATAQVWYLWNPPTGTKQVVTEWSPNFACGAISLKVCDLRNGPARVTSSGGTGTSCTDDLLADTGGIVIDAVAASNASGLVIGAGQTVVFNTSGAGGVFGGSYERADGTRTMSWSWTGSLQWGHAVVSVSAAPAGNQVIWMMAKRMQDFMRDLRQGLVPPDVLQRRWRDCLRPI